MDKKLVSMLTWILFYVNLAIILEINTFKIEHDNVNPNNEHPDSKLSSSLRN